VARLDQRASFLNLIVVAPALALVIAGGAVIGTGLALGVFLIVAGVTLLQLIWLPALRLRQIGRPGRSSSDSSRPGGEVLDDHTEP